ncbi:hypothetical protein PMZ80_009987 [Knufia obscura]|uniref:Glutamine amidotransferase type-2 domain-containing protein n=1 Tax=Knufia obscura TaxID=1635080 RepID=A0ABR0RB52_9EURO|nr:hypothetical protein PMZ80_009987 [Knufia obscura]
MFFAKDADTLGRRGPDALGTHQITALAGSTAWYLTFASSVLALRGDQIHAQPVIDEPTGSVFCWNGEAWLFDGNKISANDTKDISTHLFLAAANAQSMGEAVSEILGKIAGPYAFVFYDGKSSQLYFGRDDLGRRSLLISQDNDNSNQLTISSVAPSTSTSAFCEVDTTSIYSVDLTQPELTIQTLPSRTLLPCINRSLPGSGSLQENMPSAHTGQHLIDQLKHSLVYRVEQIPTYTPHGQGTDPSRVAILFSGGLDCTLLARLTHDILPHDQPIDLLNVAFENPRVVSARAAEKSKPGATTTTNTYEACPDRITGRSSFMELSTACPERTWRFVAINIPYEEFLKHRSTVVHLMHPHNTEMDLSITAALYFAARGQGCVTSSAHASTEAQPYTTTARALLSGLGADELFGGYARHAAAFTRGGYEALNDELELDFTRIGKRNLGRDDRVIAHWGRETRYPFLDETFVSFALGLPAWEKCGFRPGKATPKHFETTIVPERAEELHPEKMLLRCAMWQLGMKGAAAEKKRAIQFGARTAKMHGGRTKGTDIVTKVDGFWE